MQNQEDYAGTDSQEKQSVFTDGAVGVRGICEFSSLGKSEVYKALKGNELPSYKIGRRRVVAKRDLIAWLAKRAVPQV